LSLTEPISEYIAAARSPPGFDPPKRQLFLLCGGSHKRNYLQSSAKLKCSVNSPRSEDTNPSQVPSPNRTHAHKRWLADERSNPGHRTSRSEETGVHRVRLGLKQSSNGRMGHTEEATLLTFLREGMGRGVRELRSEWN
jgi:hypothetical protein